MTKQKEWRPRFGEWIEDGRKTLCDPTRRVRFVSSNRPDEYWCVVDPRGHVFAIPSSSCVPAQSFHYITAGLRRRLLVLVREARRAKRSPVYYTPSDRSALGEILEALEAMKLTESGAE